MTKSKIIKLECLECSGGSSKEVTLCAIPRCRYWEYRFGYSPKDKRYAARMQKAAKRWPKEFLEMMKIREEPKNGSN